MKLYYHNRGLHWALGIEGTKAQINTQFDSLFNHGAIEKTADLQWMGESFAYVWTTQERLKKYFRNASYHEVLNSIDDGVEWASKGLRFGAMVSRRIRERAKERYDEMTNENFLPACDAYSIPWTMGTISAEKPDD
jgi:hypothetical protein